ncbi:MAG TPA: cytochrome c biogenesis protein ResB, partial [Flavobacteriaceae bacterium]|nr:cytochrome c biogenesis protein ResB [Flavobacteriaceae bacterium]
QLLVLFRQKGFEGINLFIENNVPKHEREKVKEYYFDQVSLALQSIYLELVEPIEPETKKLSEFDKQWFEDAIVVINSLSKYGPPLYFELTSFEHIEATGLQITKSPGKNTVFFGSTLLIIGIFILFYLRQKRIWIAYSSTDNTITVAGKDSRDLPENKHEFAKLANIIKNDLKGRE